MAGKTTPVLLVTANVGSIFEDPSHMLKIWTEEFLSTVAKLDPKFIALHCQEVGGKNYERSMKHVEDFVRLFMSSEELRLFDKVRVFLDEDYSSAENFTALGNFYFIHESLAEVLLWDFAAMTFVSAKGKEVHSGNIEAVTTKEKSKFPQDFFPECKWSRKGFLRTRWSINGTVFDLINIHLFHDASNFVAMESFPSVYCKNRRRALEHTLERFHNDSYGIAPFFVFGDFNFRTDTQGVINKLSDGLNAVRIQSNKSNDHTKVQYKDEASQVVLSLGKKEFSHADHQTVFFDENGLWLKEYDRELEAFGGRLFEFAIDFPPSYPFEEDEKGGNNYMKTRCPAWCDRVLLSNTAKNLVNNISAPSCVEYGLMGSNTCMGDHKPVYLKMDLINDAGIVSCCTSCESSSSDKSVLCFGNVLVCETASWSCSSLSLKKSGSAPSALTLKLDTSSPALAADCFLAPPHASLLHEPYTPESMETPTSSPVPLRIHRDFGDLEVDWKCESDDDEVLESVLKAGTNSSTEYNVKYPCQSTNENNAFSLSHNSEMNIPSESSKEGLQGCIPHVLICYSDPQERYFNGSKLTFNTNDFNSRHSEPNLSAYSSTSEDREANLFNPHRILKEDTKTVSQISLEDLGTGNECSMMPTGVIQENVCDSTRSCEDNLVSPHSQKTCSSDSGILPSFSCNSSTQSVNQTIPKEDHSEIGRNSDIEVEESSEKSNKLLKKKNLEVENKETSESILDTNYLETKIKLHDNKATNEILTIEGTFIDNCTLNASSKDSVATSNSSVRNSHNDDCRPEYRVPEALCSVAHECTTEIMHSSNTDFGVFDNLRSDSGEPKKNPNIPVSSQDSISIVHAEMSSQVKKTKQEKYKSKKTRLKISNSNCCCIA